MSSYAVEGTSHSRIGTAAKSCKGEESTMSLNLGTNRQRYTILHEFGHALGLGHEHQHVDAPDNIFKEDELRDHLMKKCSAEDAERKIATQYRKKKRDDPEGPYRCEDYDRFSIMHYRLVLVAYMYIVCEWIKGSGFL